MNKSLLFCFKTRESQVIFFFRFVDQKKTAFVTKCTTLERPITVRKDLCSLQHVHISELNQTTDVDIIFGFVKMWLEKVQYPCLRLMCCS